MQWWALSGEQVAFILLLAAMLAALIELGCWIICGARDPLRPDDDE